MRQMGLSALVVGAAGLAALYFAPFGGPVAAPNDGPDTASTGATEVVLSYTDERGDCSGEEHVSDDERVTYVQACEGVGGWRWFAEASEHGETSRFSDRNDPGTRGQYGGYIGNFGQFHTVIEWIVGADGMPFATIHRYMSATFETGDAVTQETLIVTALRPGGTPSSCHVGLVDASAVSNANRIAREMADRLADGFDCGTETVWVVDTDSPSLDAALENGSTRRAN